MKSKTCANCGRKYNFFLRHLNPNLKHQQKLNYFLYFAAQMIMKGGVYKDLKGVQVAIRHSSEEIMKP
jgi:hypothetical protein